MDNQYETVVIFTPILSEDEAKKQVAKYKEKISEAGGSIVAEEHWGLKQLAYSIQKKTTGIYHIFEYTVKGDFINELEVNFKRDENVLRFLTTVLDKDAIDYNIRKRNGEIGKKKKETVVVEEKVEVVTKQEEVVEKGTDPELEKLKQKAE